MEYLDKENIEYLNSPITALKGIGPKKAELFSKLGVHSILDLIYYLPRGYEDRRSIKNVAECQSGEICCIKVRPVRQIVEKRLRPKLSLFLLYASDGENYVTVKWFSAPFSKPAVKRGAEYVIYGKMLFSQNGREFEMRYMENVDEMKYTGVLVPLYHATNGLNSKTIADTVKLAYQKNPVLPESLSADIRESYGLCDINSALFAIHNPEQNDEFEKYRRRLAFEELFTLQLALFRIKSKRGEKDAVSINISKAVKEYAASLPFELTDGQKEAVNSIALDLKSGKPMNRLIQGDVGCGKTAVAAAAVYAVAKAGYQSAFMAPTEILAVQHYNTLSKLFGDKVRVALLTSSVKNKGAVLSEIESGLCDVVVGTHAVLEDNVNFKNLVLSITDEQHRFGVNQRAILGSKGYNPHVLVMSATPIPRTLSLILYGDVDVSIINTIPKGRQKIETYHVNSALRQRAYGFIRKQAENGNQAYVVCPLVEETDSFDALSVDETVSLAENYLKGLRVSSIHGKMKPADKDRIMKEFKNGDIDVLISTTVIEVGVDVPNATMMLIENAERFGLSQLHQLRGRVGRGGDKSYCVLISDSQNENSEKRMKIMTELSDGFEISAKDLEMRGGGEFFGTRQHGLPELKVANLFSDLEILKEAQKAASDVTKNDPELSCDEWIYIKNRIDTMFDSLDNENIFN